MNPDDFKVRAAQAQALLEAMGLPDSQPVLKLPPPIETFIDAPEEPSSIGVGGEGEGEDKVVGYEGARVGGVPHGAGSGRFKDGGS